MVENIFFLDIKHVKKGEKKSISTEWGGDKFKFGESPIPLEEYVFFSLYNFPRIMFHSQGSLCNVVFLLVILCLKLHKLLIPLKQVLTR